MLEARSLEKEFPTPAGSLSILKGVDLSLAAGDAVSIMGPSGGGKSTLLFILGGLESPSKGTVELEGQNPFALDDAALSKFRNDKVGFVFQDHCLLPQCTVLENVLAPTWVASPGERVDHVEKATALIERVGLAPRSGHRPAELSGGEKQRVAIARALVRDPKMLLCDEPTGNLDSETASSVASLLLELDPDHERILIVVTHSAALADRFTRRMELSLGKLVDRPTSGQA